MKASVIATLMLTALQMVAENVQCEMPEVEINIAAKELTMETDTPNAEITYTITSADATPASGPSGLTINLKGIYNMTCYAWKEANPRSYTNYLTISWQAPALLPSSTE